SNCSHSCTNCSRSSVLMRISSWLSFLLSFIFLGLSDIDNAHVKNESQPERYSHCIYVFIKGKPRALSLSLRLGHTSCSWPVHIGLYFNNKQRTAQAIRRRIAFQEVGLMDILYFWPTF